MNKEVSNSEMDLTIIGAEMQVNGELFTSSDVRIDGKFYGELQTKGKIVVSKNGYAEGNVKGGNIVIMGKAKGKFEAENNFYFLRDSSFKGSVKTRFINITESADFEGVCDISPKHEDIEFVKSPIDASFDKPKEVFDLQAADTTSSDKQLEKPSFREEKADKEKPKQLEETSENLNKSSQSLLTSKISQIKSL